MTSNVGAASVPVAVSTDAPFRFICAGATSFDRQAPRVPSPRRNSRCVRSRRKRTCKALLHERFPCPPSLAEGPDSCLVASGDIDRGHVVFMSTAAPVPAPSTAASSRMTAAAPGRGASWAPARSPIGHRRPGPRTAARSPTSEKPAPPAASRGVRSNQPRTAT